MTVPQLGIGVEAPYIGIEQRCGRIFWQLVSSRNRELAKKAKHKSA
jgi:hypothetical protein